jgi:hypothetical protein
MVSLLFRLVSLPRVGSILAAFHISVHGGWLENITARERV